MVTATQKIPAGYKQTEIGVIPEDWGTDNLGQAISGVIDNRGKTPPLVPQGYPLLEVNAIYGEGKYPDFTKVSKYVDEGIYKNWFRNGHPNKGDIIIATVGTVGASSIIGEERGCIAQNIVGLRISKDYDCQFIYYYTKTEHYKSQVRAVLMGAVQPSLKVPHLWNFLIAHPLNKAEQSTIGSVLSDIDALIVSLEKLIAKKRAIKQGTMQELLTGKRRLPGFSGKWEVQKLKELDLDISDGNYSSKYPKPNDFKKMGIPFIRANNIKFLKIIDDDMRYISEDLHVELLKGHLKKNDVLITTRGEIGQVALVPDRHVGSNINAQIVRINTENKINRAYFAYYLLQKGTQEKLLNLQTGSALKQLPVGKLLELPIILPPKEEQIAITEILIAIDADIEALERKLAKYRLVKQGMMQVLLPGKVRLV